METIEEYLLIQAIKEEISKFDYLKMKTFYQKYKRQTGDVFIILKANKKLFSFIDKCLIRKIYNRKMVDKNHKNIKILL